MLETIGRVLLFTLAIAAVIGWRLGFAFPVSHDARLIRDRLAKPGRRVSDLRRTGIEFSFRRYPVRRYEVTLQSEDGAQEVRGVGLQDSALGTVWWRYDRQRDRWWIV